MFEYDLFTDGGSLFEITDQVINAVKESGVKDGIVQVYVPHSTAGVSIISNVDELGFLDVENEINRLIPTRIDFKHQFDTPSDAAGHIKSMLIGVSISLIIDNGDLILGSSQGIFFFEFDGPRKRHFYVKVTGCGDNIG